MKHCTGRGHEPCPSRRCWRCGVQQDQVRIRTPGGGGHTCLIRELTIPPRYKYFSERGSMVAGRGYNHMIGGTARNRCVRSVSQVRRLWRPGHESAAIRPLGHQVDGRVFGGGWLLGAVLAALRTTFPPLRQQYFATETIFSPLRQRFVCRERLIGALPPGELGDHVQPRRWL